MFKLRSISSSDVALICSHREAMFKEAGKPRSDIAAMSAPFAAWLQPRLIDNRYFGFVAEDDAGRPLGGVGLLMLDWPPHPSHPNEPHRGYVLNVYVEPPYRGCGIARGLMKASGEAFVERGISYAVLHATDAGRPLYDRLGWSPTTEMAKQFSEKAVELGGGITRAAVC